MTERMTIPREAVSAAREAYREAWTAWAVGHGVSRPSVDAFFDTHMAEPLAVAWTAALEAGMAAATHPKTEDRHDGR